MTNRWTSRYNMVNAIWASDIQCIQIFQGALLSLWSCAIDSPRRCNVLPTKIEKQSVILCVCVCVRACVSYTRQIILYDIIAFYGNHINSANDWSVQHSACTMSAWIDMYSIKLVLFTAHVLTVALAIFSCFFSLQCPNCPSQLNGRPLSFASKHAHKRI